MKCHCWSGGPNEMGGEAMVVVMDRGKMKSEDKNEKERHRVSLMLQRWRCLVYLSLVYLRPRISGVGLK